MVLKHKKQENMIGQIIILILLLMLTFIVTLSLSSNPFSNLLPAHDSSMFQYFGYAMDHGKTLYTEIFDHKGPMIFIINYIGTLLSTQQIHGIYFMEFISIFVYFLFSYKTVRLWLSKILSFITVIPQGIILMNYLEKGNLTEEYALPFIAISLYIYAKYFVQPESTNNLEVIFLGFSSALVFSLRANMVVLWLAFSFVIFLQLLIGKEYKRLLKYIFSFIGGLLLFFVPMSGYLYINGALEAAVFQSITFNVVYLDATSQVDAVLELYTLLNRDFIILLFASFLAYMVFHWQKADKNRKYFYAGILLFSIGSYATSILSGRSYTHYLMTMLPVMTLPTALLIEKLTDKVSKYQITVLALVLIGLIYYPRIKDNYKAVYVINTPAEEINVEALEQSDKNNADELLREKQEILKKADEKERLLEVARIIQENSEPSDNIYAHKRAGNVYLSSDRLSSIKYFNLPSVNINENKMIAEDFLTDITQSETELIIITSSFNNDEKVGAEKEFFDYITNNYRLIYDQNGYCIYKAL